MGGGGGSEKEVRLKLTFKDLKIFSMDSRLAPTTFLSLSVRAVAARLSTVLLTRNCKSSTVKREREKLNTS